MACDKQGEHFFPFKWLYFEINCANKKNLEMEEIIY